MADISDIDFLNKRLIRQLHRFQIGPRLMISMNMGVCAEGNALMP